MLILITHKYLYRLEFPYPKETPFKDKTGTIKDTNNPEYKHTVMVPVNIKEKACQRVFKRGTAKVEVWSKGGFVCLRILGCLNLNTICF